jgi:hypothetical protein
LLQRKFSDLEQDPVAAAHARGDSSDPSEQSETLSQTELHKMQRELSHRYLEENKYKFIKIVLIRRRQQRIIHFESKISSNHFMR